VVGYPQQRELVLIPVSLNEGVYVATLLLEISQKGGLVVRAMSVEVFRAGLYRPLNVSKEEVWSIAITADMCVSPGSIQLQSMAEGVVAAG
jgi:hypothetical protein